MDCQICGTPGGNDLFSFVTQQPACSQCVLQFKLRTPVNPQQVATVRKQLGLQPGEYHKYDRVEHAQEVLGKASQQKEEEEDYIPF